MAKLSRITETGHFSPREEWVLDNGFKIVVALDSEICTLFINDAKGNNFAEIVSKILEANGITNDLTGTIDNCCIELPIKNKIAVIELVEKSL